MAIQRQKMSVLFLLLFYTGIALTGASVSASENDTPPYSFHFQDPFRLKAHDWKMLFKPDASSDIRFILSKYYKTSEYTVEEKAFKRVLQWKADFKHISQEYRYVNWRLLAAIVKAETQGKTGRQVSNAMAVGMPQIKYQGAWAFYWDAMFSEMIKHGPTYERDYYNANIRTRYKRHLDRISHYLKVKAILIHPPETTKSAYPYRLARSRSWENLKRHLNRRFEPGEYQVAIDIAAMYIDHLIDTFTKIKWQVVEIRLHVKNSRNKRIDEIQFSGIHHIRMNRIKEFLRKTPEYSKSDDAHLFTISYLNHMLDRLEDPDLFSAAYNFGPRNVLEYIQSGQKLPKAIERYVKKVATYNRIFIEIDKLSV